MVWIRETLRMLTYMAVPCAAFTLVNLPFFIERTISSERISLHKRSGVDLMPNDPDSIEDAYTKYVNKLRIPLLWARDSEKLEEPDEESTKTEK